MRIIERIPAESAPNAGPYAKSALARRISRITPAHKQHIVPHNPHTQGHKTAKFNEDSAHHSHYYDVFCLYAHCLPPISSTTIC